MIKTLKMEELYTFDELNFGLQQNAVRAYTDELQTIHAACEMGGNFRFSDSEWGDMIQKAEEAGKTLPKDQPIMLSWDSVNHIDIETGWLDLDNLRLNPSCYNPFIFIVGSKESAEFDKIFYSRKLRRHSLLFKGDSCIARANQAICGRRFKEIFIDKFVSNVRDAYEKLGSVEYISEELRRGGYLFDAAGHPPEINLTMDNLLIDRTNCPEVAKRHLTWK